MSFVNKKQLEDFDKSVLSKYIGKKEPLMQILQESQQLFGCVPIEVQLLISKRTEYTPANINGVVSFYSMFSLEPRGKHIIGVCTGTACYVKGSQRLVDRVVDILKTPYGETTKDKQFTLADTRCVGSCSLAPVIMVDEEIYGNVSSDDVPKIIGKYK